MQTTKDTAKFYLTAFFFISYREGGKRKSTLTYKAFKIHYGMYTNGVGVYA